MDNKENLNSEVVVPEKEEYFIKNMVFNEDESIVVLVKPRDYGMILND